MSQDNDGPVPVDVLFQQMLAKARSLRESKEKLEQTSNALHQRAAQEANRIALRFEWKPVRCVALIEEQTCKTCGHTSQMFRGFAVMMRRAADQTTRFIEAHGVDHGLPLARHALHSTSEACIECLPERGM